jgi:predicted transcriptional regulator
MHIFLSDAALLERLARQASREQRTKTAVVVRALERYLAVEEPKAEADDRAA